MSSTSRRIDKLMEQVDVTPWGPEERAMLNEALALAVESGDDKREYRVRMRLTSSAKMSGDTDTMLSSFAWCVGKHDSDPKRFPVDVTDGRQADLYWQYKWMAATLSASPIFPVEQIRAVLTDMEERYTRAGVGLSGVLTARFEVARMNGWHDETAAMFEERLRTEEDDYSHCDACVRSVNGDYLAETGREAEAIRLYEEMLEGGYSCGEEPERALSQSLLPYLRAGSLDKAKSAHMRSYRDARDNADNIGIIANHFIFCALTGNEARGLAMLERHIGWIAHDGLNQSGQFEALMAIGLLLDAVARAGHGDAPVRGAEQPALAQFFGEHEGVWSAADLATAAWGAAERIGAAFDARNGNDHYARQVSRTRALAEEHYDVPIHTDGFTPAAVSAPEPDPTDAAGWIVRMRERGTCGDGHASIAAAEQGLAANPDLKQRARLLGGIISTAVSMDDLDRAAAGLPARIAALRDASDHDQAALEERRGLLMFGTATDADIPVLRSELDAVTDATPGATVSDIAVTLAMAMLDAEQYDEAVPVLEQAIAATTPDSQLYTRWMALLFLAQIQGRRGEFEAARAAVEQLITEQPDRSLLGNALRFRGSMNGGSGDYEAGVADAEAALEIHLALGARRPAIDDCLLASNLLDDLGRGAEAVGKLRLAVQQGELAESETLPALRFSLGRQLVRSGFGAEGTEMLNDIYQSETENGAPPGARAETLFWLGHGFRGEEEYGPAVSVWQLATELYVEAEDWSSAAGTGLALGRLFLQADMMEPALEVLTAAVEHARKEPENLSMLTDVLHTYGRALCENGDSSGLATLDEVIALATEHDATWLLADVSDSRGRGLFSLGRPDEAISGVLAAADLYLATGDTNSAGSSALFAARVLVSQERRDESVALYRSALDHFDGVPEMTQGATLELADTLEALGRHAEAADVRASVA